MLRLPANHLFPRKSFSLFIHFAAIVFKGLSHFATPRWSLPLQIRLARDSCRPYLRAMFRQHRVNFLDACGFGNRWNSANYRIFNDSRATAWCKGDATNLSRSSGRARETNRRDVVATTLTPAISNTTRAIEMKSPAPRNNAIPVMTKHSTRVYIPCPPISLRVAPCPRHSIAPEN